MKKEIKKEIKIDIHNLLIQDVFTSLISAGSTGCKGGDWGHGSRSVIGFYNDGGMGFSVEVQTPDGKKSFELADQVNLIFGGDAEVSLLPAMLRWMAKKLEVSMAEKGVMFEASEESVNKYKIVEDADGSDLLILRK